MKINVQERKKMSNKQFSRKLKFGESSGLGTQKSSQMKKSLNAVYKEASQPIVLN